MGKDDINIISEALKLNKYRITKHSRDEAQNDRLNFNEIFCSVFQGEIIEEYPKENDCQYYLIYGKNFSGEPIHSVWAYNELTQFVALITVYRPDPTRWIDYRQRRK
jgi:hypothetical protein